MRHCAQCTDFVHLNMIAMIGASDQPCWLAEACKILILLTLQQWMMDFYQLPGVAKASNMDHCRKGYFGRHGNNIIPVGPKLSYSFKQ